MIYTCQPFSTTDNPYFIRMIRSAGCSKHILKQDTIKTKMQARMAQINKETADLLLKTATTVALSLDS